MIEINVCTANGSQSKQTPNMKEDNRRPEL